jgi:hypothetical protein
VAPKRIKTAVPIGCSAAVIHAEIGEWMRRDKPNSTAAGFR